MSSRSEYWICILFGLCIYACIVQCLNPEEEEYDEYVDDAKDGGKAELETPIITTVPKVIDVVEADDIRLECKGHHFEEYSLLWNKHPLGPNSLISVDNELKVLNDSARYQILEDGKILLIKDAVLSDSGSYNCSIFYTSIVHNVTVRPRPSDISPMVLMVPYITIDPARFTTVNENECINLTCTVRTEGKQIDFYWQKKTAQEMENMKIENTILSRLSKTTVENRLMFKSVSRHDAGDYLCFFQDDVGTAESDVHLNVNFPPIVHTRRDAVHASLGKSLQLRCVILAVPKADVTWFKSDKDKLVPIRARDGFRMRSDFQTHILFIKNLTQSEFGTYTCEARNVFPTATVAKIEVVGAPSQPLLVEERMKLGEEHMNYDLVWEIESSIPIETNVVRFRRKPEAKWTDIFVEATQIPNQPLFYEVTYTLVNLTIDSTYEATLQSKNKFGWSSDARTHTFTITVLNPAGNEDESINLTCTVRTKGKQIDFYWPKTTAQEMKNMNIDNTTLSRLSNTTEEYRLIFKSVSRRDDDDYLCIDVFHDDVGTADSDVRLNVNFPPIVHTRRHAVHASLGENLELRCVVLAVPRAHVTWFKSDKDKSKLVPIRASRDRFRVSSDHHTHILYIVYLTQSDFGTYTCEAKNAFSTAAVAKIEVFGAPSQPLLVEELTKLGEKHMSYDLVWTVESSIPIEKNAVRFRREPEAEWTDVFVEGTQIPNQPSFYEVAYTLVNLTSASTYEVTLQSKNKFGWSSDARSHRFTTSSKSDTDTIELIDDTMELSDDKRSKAPGLLYPSNLLVSSSISLFLIRRW